MFRHLNRRHLLTSALALLGAGLLPKAVRAKYKGPDYTPNYTFEVVRSDAEWHEMLSDEEYRILREGGTEKPKSSPLWDETSAGLYHCKGCDLPIHDAEWKTVLEKGWLFFYHAIPHAVMTKVDGVPGRYLNGRDIAPVSTIETHCRRCGSHIGHIFNVDGDLLHCVNGASLTFRPTST